MAAPELSRPPVFVDRRRRPAAAPLAADPQPRHAGESRIGPLPRRAQIDRSSGETAPARMRVVAFRARRRQSVRRLFAALAATVLMAGRMAADQLAGRNDARARARHVAAAVRLMGGTFIRMAHRIAIRGALLQSPYAEEVAQVRDAVPPFAAELAIAAVERATGRPLHETFARFDPDPILSTSTACTYQAMLPDGERVVAKVRRPGAGEALMSDLRLVDWLGAALEALSVVPRGYTRTLRRELRAALLEELDFVREARHQDAFRRTARRKGKRFFTAPRVHFELSGEDVIVQEFVSGVWLWELIAAVEQGHEGVLAHARSLGIHPEVVARRLLWVGFWSWHENLFVLAEPSPYNVILGAGGTLAFIDFTSTGSVDRSMKRAMQKNLSYALRRDPLNMARATLPLLEPLPPVDPIALTKELEAANLQMLYAFASNPKGPRALPRTSLLQWRGLLEAARRFSIPVEYGVLRLIRSAVVLEHMALRLDPKVNLLRRYERFVRDRADRAADPFGEPAARRWKTAFDRRGYLRLEQVAKAGENFAFRMRQLLSSPRVNFHAMIGKSAYAALAVVTFLTRAAQLVALAAAAVAIHGLWNGAVPVARDVWSTVWQSPWVLGALAATLLVGVRALFYRLDDTDLQ